MKYYAEEKTLDKIDNQIVLIFDLDGTLIDTNSANFLAYKEAVLKVKGLDLDLLYLDTERFTREKLKKIIPNITNMEFKKIIEIKDKVFYKYLNKTKINILYLELIRQYSKTNKIILATNSSKVRAELILKFYNLVEIFDFIFYKENYNNYKIGKYEYVLNVLKLDPKSVIIFDNEQSELTNAQFAGIPAKNIMKS
jgi:FMN phosphatase YigB (HAD superfamily)